jgi:hypothetical protein
MEDADMLARERVRERMRRREHDDAGERVLAADRQLSFQHGGTKGDTILLSRDTIWVLAECAPVAPRLFACS